MTSKLHSKIYMLNSLLYFDCVLKCLNASKVIFLISNYRLRAVSVRKLPERMPNFWTVQFAFLKTEFEPIFGFQHPWDTVYYAADFVSSAICWQAALVLHSRWSRKESFLEKTENVSFSVFFLILVFLLNLHCILLSVNCMCTQSLRTVVLC